MKKPSLNQSADTFSIRELELSISVFFFKEPCKLPHTALSVNRLLNNKALYIVACMQFIKEQFSFSFGFGFISSMSLNYHLVSTLNSSVFAQ